MNNKLSTLLRNPLRLKIILELNESKKDLCMSGINRRIDSTYAHLHRSMIELVKINLVKEKKSDNKRVRIFVLTNKGLAFAEKLKEMNLILR